MTPLFGLFDVDNDDAGDERGIYEHVTRVKASSVHTT